LETGSALKEEHIVLISQMKQPPDSSDGIGHYVIKPRGSMANFCDGHSGSLKIKEIGLNLFQNRQR
jgi:hypothetical protein